MARLLLPLGIALLGLIEPGRCQAADRPGDRVLDAQGVKIRYSVQGRGEPVVLLHGWLSSALINWELPGTSALLARNYQVIALDVRGHGQSDKPLDENAYGPELVEDVVRLLDHLNLQKAHIVGYSMGGIIAGNFIARHPDRALSATLCGMGWLQKGGIGEWGFSRIARNDPHAGAQAVCGRSLARLALSEDEIKAIRVPVAIVVGNEDNLIRRLYVEPAQKVRADWPVIGINDANHLSCVIRPQFREEIAAWLARNRRPADR
ncbi:MAG: alpha/beta fold hydrolase [Planctomycetaceae bacterium]